MIECLKNTYCGYNRSVSLISGLMIISLFLFSSSILGLNNPQLSNKETDVNISLLSSAAPLYFIMNQGQFPGEVMYHSNLLDHSLWLLKDSILFSTVIPDNTSNMTTSEERLITDFTRMKFIGINPKVKLTSGPRELYKVNYLKGKDKSGWIVDVPTSKSVLYKSLYNGIDLEVYGMGQRVEYDWHIAPGGDPLRIKYTFENAENLTILTNGNLEIATRFGTLVHKKPVAYQEINGKKISVKARFIMDDDKAIGFAVGEYNRNYPLVIDPLVLRYSTFFGGSSSEYGYAVAVDNNYSAFIAGRTRSTNMPVENAYQSAIAGDYDVFVTKFTREGRDLVYSTYVGGSNHDRGYAVAVDASGYAYITGYTQSDNFPMQNAYDNTRNGTDAFVFKLAPDGSSLVYSTFLGGADTEYGEGIISDNAGAAYITGRTNSNDFPVQNPYQAARSGNNDVFVTKFRTSGAMDYSTYIGSPGNDYGYDIAVSGGGEAVVSGYSNNNNYPTVAGSYQTSRAGGNDAVITKLNANGDGLIFSTYLGGSGDDRGYRIALDSQNNVHVAGETRSNNFPTMNPYQLARAGNRDAFISKLSRDGSTLMNSTYLGGSGNEYTWDIATHNNRACIVGYTVSDNFPTHNPYQASRAGSNDVFISMLEDSGSALVFSSYFGGSGADYGRGIAISRTGGIFITGYTQSNNFPVERAYKPVRQGTDAFLSKFNWIGDERHPVPILKADKYGGFPPLMVNFDGSESYDPDGVITNYRWNIEQLSTFTGETGSYEFLQKGTFKVYLNVRDNDGFSSKASDLITIYDEKDIIVLLDTNGISRIRANSKEDLNIQAYVLEFSDRGLQLVFKKLDISLGTSSGIFKENFSFDSNNAAYNQTLRSGPPGYAKVSALMSGVEMASTMIEFYWPRPPVDLRLSLTANRALFIVEYVGKLFWSPNPAQSEIPDEYRVYKSTNGSEYELIGSVSGDIAEIDINRILGSNKYSFVVTSIVDGEESEYSTPLNWEMPRN